MIQPQSGRDVTAMNVLDAVRLAGMPRNHQICCLASAARADAGPHCDPLSVSHIVRMLVDADEAKLFELEVATEIRRQRSIRSERRSLRMSSIDLLKMGSQLTVHHRLNRLCPAIFGPSEQWTPFGALARSSGRPVFNWLKRDSSGVLVAGMDRIRVDECATGFVIKRSRDQPTLYSLLPRRADSFSELMLLLGLPQRFLDGRPVGIDWDNRKLIVSKSIALPWVYP